MRLGPKKKQGFYFVLFISEHVVLGSLRQHVRSPALQQLPCYRDHTGIKVPEEPQVPASSYLSPPRIHCQMCDENLQMILVPSL